MEDSTYLILVSSPRVKGLNHRLILNRQVTDELQHHAQVIDRQLRAQLTQEGWFETEELIACATLVQQDGGRTGFEIIAIHGVYALEHKTQIRATIEAIKSRVADYITDPDLLASAKHRLVVSYPFPSIAADLDRVYTRPLPRFDYAREQERSLSPAPKASSDSSQSSLKVMIGLSTLVMIVILGVIVMWYSAQRAGDEDAQDGRYVLESLTLELSESCPIQKVTSLIIAPNSSHACVGLKNLSDVSFEAEPTPQIKFQYDAKNFAVNLEDKTCQATHGMSPFLKVKGNFKLEKNGWLFSSAYIGDYHDGVFDQQGNLIEQCYATIRMIAKKSP